jgi:hypothetical protein
MSGKRSSNIIEDYIYRNADTLFLRNNITDQKELIISNIILSLIKGSINIDYYSLIPLLPSKMQEVVKLRWEAIIKIFNNELEEAEDLLVQSLNSAKANRVEQWIRRDILLDLRNLEVVKYNKQNAFLYDSQRQKELKAMDKWNYRPFLDWGMENASFELVKENLNINTDAPHTIRFGGTLNSSMVKILESFEEAVINGSYTFIHIIRERLAYILYNYGKIYKESRLIFHSLKLFMIESKIKIAQRILDSEWDDLYIEIIDDPSTLINLPFLENNRTEDIVMKCVMIEKFGAYFYDEDLNEITFFLGTCLNQELSMIDSLDVKRHAVRAYKDIINRVKSEDILNKFSEMLMEDNDLVNEEILKIINKINWKNVLIEKCNDLALSIYKKAEISMLTTSVYNVLSNIKKAHPNTLRTIEEDLKKKWIECKCLDINNYFSIHSPSDLLKGAMIKDTIEKIRTNNEKVTEDSPISLGGFSLSQILANHLMDLSIFDSEIFDVYTEILFNPYQLTSEKRQFVESIIRLIKFNEQFSILAKEKLRGTLQGKFTEILLSRSDDFFEKSSKERLELKLQELFIFLDIKHKHMNEILAKCVEFGNHPFIGVREDTLSLVKAISRNYGNLHQNEIIQFLYLKTYDNWYKIRGDSIFLLNEISAEAKEWQNVVINRMFELIDDSNPYVRSSIIAAALKKINDNIENQQYISILAILKRDRHYKLRDQVLKK